jgi:uncharacterized protein YkwD
MVEVERFVQRAVLVLLLGGCTAHGPLARGTPREVVAWERQVHELVNVYRAGEGLPRLSYHGGLAAIARQHSQAMAAGEVAFGHSGFEDRAHRATRHLVLADLGENLLATQLSSNSVAWRAVGGWLKSATHRQVIEGCFTLSGVGVAVDDTGVIYLTQLFGLEPEARGRPRCALRQRRELPE